MNIPAIPLPSVSPPSASVAPEGRPKAPAGALRLFGLEMSLATGSLDSLEDVTRSPLWVEIGDWFARSPGTEELAVLSTCHRVELILLVRSAQDLEPWLGRLPGSPASWKAREGRDVVHHLFRVAAGLESLAVGETEARHQVRAAGRGISSRHPRPVLREIFAAAADAANDLIPPQPSTPSIAAVAADRLLEMVDRPDPRVVVIGSGIVGRQVAGRLANKARVSVVYHERPPEEDFLRAVGARATRLGEMAGVLATADAIVTAAKFGDHSLTSSDLPAERPLLLFDLGVPRNIDPKVRQRSDVRLVDLAELYLHRRERAAASDVDQRVRELSDRLSDRVDPLLLEPWVDAVRRSAEEVRRGELEEARPYLGRLDPAQELALERLTRRLVARLLLPATDRIRAIPPGPAGDEQRRLAVDLLSPRPDEP